MSKHIQVIRGMHDILPQQTPLWQFIEDKAREVVRAYGYQEIRLPVLEKTELFKRSIGEVTDIVEKEMYTFDDRNGDSLTLRPEGTAGCVRAGIENGLLYNQIQRLWYMGAMFRHERPQKGRYRQFHQIGVETFGLPGAEIEVELIFICARIWAALGLQGKGLQESGLHESGLQNIRLEINTLGNSEERAVYRDKLVEYLSAHEQQLDEDSKRRLHSNPLRILDSKNPELDSLIKEAPRLTEYLGKDSSAHFARLEELLNEAGIPYQVNTRLVRGLDYYSHTVFEWITDQLGAQGTICAGGRYDSLVQQLGGKPTAAAGFALGIERLVALMEDLDISVPGNEPHIYLVLVGEQAQAKGLLLAEQLRDKLTGLRLQVNCSGGNFNKQLKRADKSGARFALLMGEDELKNDTIALKDLRERAGQETIPQKKLVDTLKTVLGHK